MPDYGDEEDSDDEGKDLPAYYAFDVLKVSKASDD